MRSPSAHDTNENENHNEDASNENDDFQDPASSPFRYDGREDTVDFQKLQEYEQPPPVPRHRFGMGSVPEEPMSSPFRPQGRDETVDFQKLREMQPASPGLDQRLALEDPASSPFRPDAREDTVDFEKLREMEQPASPGFVAQPELPESSPFRPDGREDTVDFQKLHEMQQQELPAKLKRSPPAVRSPAVVHSSPVKQDVNDDIPDEEEPEVQQESPAKPKHSPPAVRPTAVVDSSPFKQDVNDDILDVEEPEVQQETIGKLKHSSPVAPSSPFKHDAKDDFPGVQEPHEVEPESIGGEPKHFSPTAQSSPFRPDGKEETVDFQKLHETQRRSISKPKNSSPVAVHNSPFRRDSKDDVLDVKKRRSVARASLALDDRSSNAATPRKRSFEHAPEGDYEDDAETREPCKKGMRAEGPEIHVDLDDESSVIHNQSSFSNTSFAQDRSTIANSVMEDKRNEGMSTVLHDENEPPANNENAGPGHDDTLGEDDHDIMDDTGLSNFSALPDMTSFAKLRAESPLKSMRGSVAPSPAPSASMRQSVDPATPGTARRSHKASTLLDMGSPTPRRRGSRDVGAPGETPNLLDLTDQMNFFPRQSLQQSARFSPSRRSPLRPTRQSIRSPSKLSLLDFDIPPAPTPRSIPTITPRELESLKSGFMSEISSLKATLSGREAEVSSLKQAVADAERRVGEALEEVRNESARKDALEIEQAEWERRGKDVERVLQSVRDELEEGERERERLIRKAEEAEKGKEKLEGRIVELESQLSAARSAASESSAANGSQNTSPSAEDTAREVQEAVEKVARELHTLYKGKHETKVAALKKSYEGRWEKRVRESEKKLAAANEENERLKAEREAAQSESTAAANASMVARESDEHEAEKHVLQAQIKGLQQEMASLKEDSERLRTDLKSERAEKGELVAAVDEWLAIQQSQPAQPQQPSQQASREPSVSSAGHPDEEYQPSSEPIQENPRRSVSRSGSSGIRPPATGEKRIPRFGAPGGHSRGNSGGKPGIAVFTPGRGGIMSSIERMGRGGA